MADNEYDNEKKGVSDPITSRPFNCESRSDEEHANLS